MSLTIDSSSCCLSSCFANLNLSGGECSKIAQQSSTPFGLAAQQSSNTVSINLEEISGNPLSLLPNSTLTEIITEAQYIHKAIIEAQINKLNMTYFEGKISSENETILQNKGYSVTVYNEKANLVRGPRICTKVEWSLPETD